MHLVNSVALLLGRLKVLIISVDDYLLLSRVSVDGLSQGVVLSLLDRCLHVFALRSRFGRHPLSSPPVPRFGAMDSALLVIWFEEARVPRFLLLQVVVYLLVPLVSLLPLSSRF